MTSITLLSGHTSPETAYVVEDYPYGFRLRCKIRYWLECDPRRGVRLATQTSNPKKPGLVWNKPKLSTYCRFAGAMYLDDAGHVHWSGLTEYTSGAEASAWRDMYGAAVPDAARAAMNGWTDAKIAFDAKRTEGASIGASILAARQAASDNIETLDNMKPRS